MTGNEKSTQEDPHPPFDFDNCGEMMAQMMSQMGKQEEMADFCAEMMSGFAGVKDTSSDRFETMSEMMASCCGKSDKSGEVPKTL